MTGHQFLFAAITAFLVVPLLPLSIAWRRFLKSASRQIVVFAGLAGLTVSALWLAFGALPFDFGAVDADNFFWGPDYSRRRFGIIGSMIAISALASILLAIWGRRIRFLCILTGMMLTMGWLYAAAISSVV